MTFFNNFVYDPSRPSRIEVKSTTLSTPSQQGFQGGMQQQSGFQGNQGGWGRGGGGMHYGKYHNVFERL